MILKLYHNCGWFFIDRIEEFQKSHFREIKIDRFPQEILSQIFDLFKDTGYFNAEWPSNFKIFWDQYQEFKYSETELEELKEILKKKDLSKVEIWLEKNDATTSVCQYWKDGICTTVYYDYKSKGTYLMNDSGQTIEVL
jgi:hypothetical protein